MTLVRNPEIPHSFEPSFAKKHGLLLATVFYATGILGWKCNDKNETVRREFEVEEAIDFLWYLPPEDVRQAFRDLKELGEVEMDDV